MPRLVLASLCVFLCALVALATEPEPTPVEKQLAIQSAMASACKHLDDNQPTDAVAALEKEVANADGNKAFLNLLREAYTAELKQLQQQPDTNTERIAQTKRKLALLGGEVPEAKSKAPPATLPDLNPPAPPGNRQPNAKTEDAVAAFKRGNFAEAEKLFAAIGAAKLTQEQKTAWAYCRIKLAADRVNASNCDAATATTAAQEVADALEMITDNAKLLASGREVLKVAQAKAASGGRKPAEAAPGDVIETGSFRISHGGNRELGDAIAKAAEASRKQIFERWSGPPGGDWQAKCQIVIHATAESYAKATGKPAALTGHATVRLTDGRATERRIDLRADDSAMVANTLPRELTHVVLADLFANTPPKWALEGMAILAGSPEEISRYTRTLPRCARDSELRNLSTLFDLKDFPADKITGFYCQSVSITEYLITRSGGERNFKIFLGDVQRYGMASALKRQYGIDSPQALEQEWKRACLEQARAQGQ